ncbi:hypothetical protein GXB78_06480 [Pseudomonas moraviensis subsp. stanleyae]|uniref:hypothetical protein n=1 Tax=Pseudomonas moraviensis TaxID=321662 RepID=UPI002E31E6F2|nr:hypothetical protein [Pseudomonas moraviensis]MED7666851.1 hypothetical protein [Pseudomonas moraviensis subsp. stanleyae]
MADEKELTEEAKKQRRKREKAAAKDAVLGVEKFTVEVAGVFKPDLKRVMAAHGINNQQEVYQLLLMNLIAADFDTQAQMLKCVTTPFVATEKVSRPIEAAGMKSFADDPPEPDDEVEKPETRAARDQVRMAPSPC